MGFNSLKGAFEALSNPDLSFGEKTLQVFQSLTMAIPSLIMGYNALTTVKWKSVAAQWAEVKAAGAKVIADTAGLVAKWLNIAADKTHTTVIWNKVKGYFALNAIKSKTLALSLKLALVLVAVVAAIAAVVKIIDVLSDAYNKDALAAERA